MNDFRIGHGYDVHALADGLPLRLGGVLIEHPRGCVAHSDGDALIHALCDALLGAAAMGDIGLHFPDTSERFKGIDSRILLRHTVEMLRDKGYRIGNVDCTPPCEKRWPRRWESILSVFRSRPRRPNGSDSSAGKRESRLMPSRWFTGKPHSKDPARQTKFPPETEFGTRSPIGTAEGSRVLGDRETERKLRVQRGSRLAPVPTKRKSVPD